MKNALDAVLFSACYRLWSLPLLPIYAKFLATKLPSNNTIMNTGLLRANSEG